VRRELLSQQKKETKLLLDELKKGADIPAVQAKQAADAPL
jgi:hypothetical protein